MLVHCSGLVSRAHLAPRSAKPTEAQYSPLATRGAKEEGYAATHSSNNGAIGFSVEWNASKASSAQSSFLQSTSAADSKASIICVSSWNRRAYNMLLSASLSAVTRG